MMNCYVTKVIGLLITAAVAVVCIAGGFYTTYRLVTLIGNN